MARNHATGISRIACFSLPPASMTSTLTDGSSVSRAASTQPEDPAPTMM